MARSLKDNRRLLEDARSILHEILSERQAANPRYSLRAFARDVRVSPQQLSNVIIGRRGFSAQTAERVASNLKLDSRRREIFVQSLQARFSASPSRRIVAQARLEAAKARGSSRDLEIELFDSICNWYHLALLGLIRLHQGRKMNVPLFARRLGIPETEVDIAIARLQRLDLISRTSRGWQIRQDSVVFDRGISTEAIRKFHRQLLERALEALAFQTADERYGSSSTLPVRVRDLDRARKLIQKFRADFEKELVSADDGDEIYGLSIQFFRLTRPETEMRQ